MEKEKLLPMDKIENTTHIKIGRTTYIIRNAKHAGERTINLPYGGGKGIADLVKYERYEPLGEGRWEDANCMTYEFRQKATIQ